MPYIPKAHEIYKHFKGNLYQIIAVAEHTETGEQLVIYQAMYGSFRIYARPLDMFMSRVDRKKYPDAAQEYRFELQGPDGGRRDGVPGSGGGRRDEEPGSGGGQRGNEPDSTAAGERGVSERASDTDVSDLGGDENSAEEKLDPMVLEFLDADTYEDRLNILAGIRHRITDEMLTTMSIACDVEVLEGSLEERYDSLRSCLLTLEKYECNRLR